MFWAKKPFLFLLLGDTIPEESTEESTEWDVEIEEPEGPDISIQGVGMAPRPEEGETLGEYAQRMAGDFGIRGLGVKLNGEMLPQNDERVNLEVLDIEGTLKIGKHSTLA